MRVPLVLLIPVVPLVAALSMAPSPSAPTAAQSTRASHVTTESRRLRAHFDSVHVELLGADVTALDVRRRASRATLVAWLRDYRDAGAFPLNDGYADHRVPIFRDRDGTLCAMAYLIERSGRGDIVDDVAASRNLERIHTLTDDPRLQVWLDSVGLTVEEAARIQPQYEPPPGEPLVEDGIPSGFAFASFVVGTTAVGTGTLATVRPSRPRALASLVTGLTAVVIGSTRVGSTSSATSQLAFADIAIGGIAMALGVRSFFLPRPGDARTREQAAAPGVAVSPTLGYASGQRSVGLALRRSF